MPWFIVEKQRAQFFCFACLTADCGLTNAGQWSNQKRIVLNTGTPNPLGDSPAAPPSSLRDSPASSLQNNLRLSF
jgi:hypothetical protein